MKKLIIIISLVTFIFTGCSTSASDSNLDEILVIEKTPTTSETQVEVEQDVKEDDEKEVIEATLIEDTATPIDPKTLIDLSLAPNEAGKIMIIMYHNIGSTESEWVRTPENFYSDLEMFYEKGYRPISLRDYVSGNITTEAGYTPIVFTFDDANQNNFSYLENGEIDPDCVVGMLTRFHEEHPDFPLEATFFADGRIPFTQADSDAKKVQYIIEHGMDIGNHTEDHNKLVSSLTPEQIQRFIGKQANYLQSLTNDDDYKVNMIALPYGIRPSDESLAPYIHKGSYDGIEYENIAVMEVGWNPAFSPYDARLNPLSLPRIRGSKIKVDNVGMFNYISYFDNHPEAKFISDGQVDVITYPSGYGDNIVEQEGKEIYEYEIEE